MGSRVDASSAHLVSGGVPMAAASKLAMENLALQGMHPSRRKQAVYATLAYTYPQASAMHANVIDSHEFATTHGSLARELPANDLHDALSMYQVSGHADLTSPAAPQYVEIVRNIAARTDMDFGSVYSHLARLAPKVAQRLNYVDAERDLSHVQSFSDLSVQLEHGRNGKATAPLIKHILEIAGAEILAQRQHLKAPPPVATIFLQNGQSLRSV